MQNGLGGRITNACLRLMDNVVRGSIEKTHRERPASNCPRSGVLPRRDLVVRYGVLLIYIARPEPNAGAERRTEAGNCWRATMVSASRQLDAYSVSSAGGGGYALANNNGDLPAARV